MLYCVPSFSSTAPMQSLSTSTAVGITAMVTGTIALIVGFLAGVLVYHCISKHQCHQLPKPGSSSHQQQQAVVPQQRTGPEYEEVVELKENRAYSELTQVEIRDSKPESSSHQQQVTVSSSISLPQTGPEYEEVVQLRQNKAYGPRPNIEIRANISEHQSQSYEPDSSFHTQQQTGTEYEKFVPAPSRDGNIDLRENVAYGPSNADSLL